MKLTSKHYNLFIKRYLFKKYNYISLQLGKGKKACESYIGVSLNSCKQGFPILITLILKKNLFTSLIFFSPHLLLCGSKSEKIIYGNDIKVELEFGKLMILEAHYNFIIYRIEFSIMWIYSRYKSDIQFLKYKHVNETLTPHSVHSKLWP